LGAAGLHASLLPKYRGGAPLVWATINGEAETGVTFFHFADGVDDGDIIGQARFAIDPEDDISSLLAKASNASIGLLSEYVPLLGAGTAPRKVQDHTQATSVPQRKPQDGQINWHQLPARQAFDWVRAQTHPYPGAFTFLGEEKVTIWRARLPQEPKTHSCAPGEIVPDSGESPGVCCADRRVLLIDEVSLSDGSTLTGVELMAKPAVVNASFAVRAAVANVI